jgi:hypothetical protein
MANDIIERNRQIGRRFVDFLLQGDGASTLMAPRRTISTTRTSSAGREPAIPNIPVL